MAAEYLTARRGEAARSTIRRLTSLKAFARWAWKMTVLEDYKAPEAAEAEPHPLPGGIADVRKMLSVAKRENHFSLVTLQGFFALRVSEARAVTAESFDRHEGQLHVRGKGSKDRRLDYAETTFELLSVPFTRSLVDGTSLCSLSDAAARAAIKSVAKLAGIEKDVSSHDLRATCLTELYDRTGDIELVRRFAGHASVKQTQVYIGSRRKALREAVSFV